MSELPLKFVVLHHVGVDEPHVDLMLELAPGKDLATWRLPGWPLDEPQDATRLRDHRRFYLTHEGEVPGGRGHVSRLDEGTWTGTADADCWAVTLASRSVMLLRLERIADDRWRVTPG